MRLESIVFHNLRRRKGRAIFLTIGLLIGVATVVTLLSLSDALGRHAQNELENFQFKQWQEVLAMGTIGFIN